VRLLPLPHGHLPPSKTTIPRLPHHLNNKINRINVENATPQITIEILEKSNSRKRKSEERKRSV